MRKFLKEVKLYIKFKIKKFIETRFFLFVLGCIICSTTVYIILVGKPYYDWAREGYIYAVEINRASAEVERENGEVVSQDTGSLANAPVEPTGQDIRELIALYSPADMQDNLLRLLMCESSLGRVRVHKNNDTRQTTDRGIWMINDYWHSEVSDEIAYNDVEATKWTIQRIKEGHLKEWNCWKVWDDVNYEVK